jgi:enoyl-CoA hydratase
MADIEFSVRGPVGHVLLNRPQALNALTHDMCRALDVQLATWTTDAAIACVVIRGAGEKAFCAGGDVRRLYDAGTAGQYEYPRAFYWDEYRLNRRIKTFPKPYIAILDGIVMGGGVGASIHGSHRIVTEHVLFAMPETGIGLFPDVGGSYFLPRLPGRIGLYLGLTGARLKAADCVHAGLATSFVPRAALPALLTALEEGRGLEQAVAAVAGDPGPAPLATQQAEVDRDFALPVERIRHPALAAKSPTALKLAAEQLRRGAMCSFDECMRMEWRMVNGVLRGHDFYEGVRALIIDKDQKPAWRPTTLAEVDESAIAACFAPRPGDELHFDQGSTAWRP